VARLLGLLDIGAVTREHLGWVLTRGRPEILGVFMDSVVAGRRGVWRSRWVAVGTAVAVMLDGGLVVTLDCIGDGAGTPPSADLPR